MLELEFQFFCRPIKKTHYNILLELSEIPYSLIPKLYSKKISQNSVTYDDGAVRWNDYFGKALSYINYDSKDATIYSKDLDLLHEIAYLLILSLSSKEMDSHGFHKIHACAFDLNQKNFIISLPSKGGKTTLFMECCKEAKIKLISDDTPVIDQSGNIHPFPLRVGLEKIPTWLPQEDYPIFRREHFSDKFLIPLTELGRDIATSNTNQNIYIIGLRSNGDIPQIHPATTSSAFKALFEHMIIGIGLPMVVEYFVRNTIGDWIRLLKIFFRRFFCAFSFWKKSRVYFFVMSNDPNLNARFLISKANEL